MLHAKIDGYVTMSIQSAPVMGPYQKKETVSYDFGYIIYLALWGIATIGR